MRVFDRGISPKAHFSMYVKSFMKKIKCFCYYSQSDKKWQSDSSSEACKKLIDSFYLTGISHFGCIAIMPILFHTAGDSLEL